MESYDRIRQLRRFTNLETLQSYELVEIPKALLIKAANFAPFMMHSSLQIPKPGRCTVIEGEQTLFELYFDGGTERKLQLQKLRKGLCTVHAHWSIKRIPLSTEAV